MAQDKRHPLSTDMNDIDLTSQTDLTDQEIETLRKTVAQAHQVKNN